MVWCFVSRTLQSKGLPLSFLINARIHYTTKIWRYRAKRLYYPIRKDFIKIINDPAGRKIVVWRREIKRPRLLGCRFPRITRYETAYLRVNHNSFEREIWQVRLVYVVIYNITAIVKTEMLVSDRCVCIISYLKCVITHGLKMMTLFLENASLTPTIHSCRRNWCD